MSQYVSMFEQLPVCAQQCISSAITATGYQGLDMASHLCLNETVQSTVTQCALGSCNATDQYQTAVITEIICFSAILTPSVDTAKVAEVILAAFTFPIVLLRFISRAFITKKLWWDDYLMMLSMVFLIPNLAMAICADSWIPDPDHVPKVLLYLWICDFLYIACQISIKYSILAFYMRVFPNTYISLASWTLIVSGLVQGTIFIFVIAFRCNPVRASYDIIPTATCMNFENIVIAGTACSIVSDLMIVVMPIPILVRLNMQWRQRAVLILLFSVCSFACLTTMVRLKYLVGFGTSIKATKHEMEALVWSLIENMSAAICACLPFLRPIFTAIYDRFIGDNDIKEVTHGTPGISSSGKRRTADEEEEEGRPDPARVVELHHNSKAVGEEKGTVVYEA